MRLKISIAVVMVLAVGGYLFASPYMTLASIRDALAENDSDTLNQKIDFPAVRQDLKDRLAFVLMKKTEKESEKNPMAMLAAGLVGSFADRLVDTLVTPIAISRMMSGSEVKDVSAGGVKIKTDPEKLKKAVDNSEMGYDSFDRFSMLMTNEKGREIRFVLGRDGIGWKLIRIEIPVDHLE